GPEPELLLGIERDRHIGAQDAQAVVEELGGIAQRVDVVALGVGQVREHDRRGDRLDGGGRLGRQRRERGEARGDVVARGGERDGAVLGRRDAEALDVERDVDGDQRTAQRDDERGQLWAGLGGLRYEVGATGRRRRAVVGIEVDRHVVDALDRHDRGDERVVDDGLPEAVGADGGGQRLADLGCERRLLRRGQRRARRRDDGLHTDGEHRAALGARGGRWQRRGRFAAGAAAGGQGGWRRQRHVVEHADPGG